MKRKLVSALLSVAMVATLLVGCGGSSDNSGASGETASEAASEAAPEAGDEEASAESEGDSEEAAPVSTDGVNITILNTKSEIQTQWEELAAKYTAETGVGVEVSVTVGDSPSQDITKRYASGEVPTIFMGDIQDILMLDEYALDLTNEDWAKDGGSQYGATYNGRLIGFPFCIEARGLMYNKTAIEATTGETFDPTAVKSLDDLQALLDKLVAGGMEAPVALNMEDWSLAGHYLTQVYEEQDCTVEGTYTFTDGLKAGTEDLNTNARFNSLFDTFDLLMKYNMNANDPLAADYNNNAVCLAEGDIAFWFNGNWAWAEMKDFAMDDSEYGIMPVPQKDDTNDVTSKLAGGASKYCMIDTAYNDEAQQQAARDFLNWLVYNEGGQDFLVNQCSLVPAFSNITLPVTNPMGQSVADYTNQGALVPGFPELPGDHWKTLGAEMQKYLGGQCTREELAKAINDYWTAQ